MGLRGTIVTILAVALLAGCLGPDTAPGALSEEPLQDAFEPSAAASLPVNLTSVDAPLWLVGDAWHATTFGGGSEEHAVFVVTAASSDSYTLETTSEQMAGYDAVSDVSFVGRIRAGDLAGYQGESAIQFFSFPLTDGKTWTTAWDGRTITLIATKAGEGFAIVGSTEEGPYVTYDYKPALKWWSKIEFSEGYGVRIDRFQANWTGTLATATASLVYESFTQMPTATLNTGSFTVSEGQSHLALFLHGGGSAWARAFNLVDPTGAPYMTATPNSETGQDHFVTYNEQLPATPGEWRISAPALHAPDSFFVVRIHEVAVGEKPFA